MSNQPEDLADKINEFCEPEIHLGHAIGLAVANHQHYVEMYPEIADIWKMIEDSLCDPARVRQCTGKDWLRKIEQPFGPRVALEVYMCYLKVFVNNAKKPLPPSYYMSRTDFDTLCKRAGITLEECKRRYDPLYDQAGAIVEQYWPGATLDSEFCFGLDN